MDNSNSNVGDYFMNDFWKKRDDWRVKNNIAPERIKLFHVSSNEWPIESIKDIQLLLSHNWEFWVSFRGDEFFITGNPDKFSVNDAWWSGETIFETADLDDFGKNAKIGHNEDECFLKDVIGELEF